LPAPYVVGAARRALPAAIGTGCSAGRAAPFPASLAAVGPGAARRFLPGVMLEWSQSCSRGLTYRDDHHRVGSIHATAVAAKKPVAQRAVPHVCCAAACKRLWPMTGHLRKNRLLTNRSLGLPHRSIALQGAFVFHGWRRARNLRCREPVDRHQRLDSAFGEPRSRRRLRAGRGGKIVTPSVRCRCNADRRIAFTHVIVR